MFTFELGSGVVMSTIDQSGIVVARSGSVTSENSYLVRYVTAEGDVSESWCGEGALKEADIALSKVGAERSADQQTVKAPAASH
jgi:hypothetical protein